MGNYNSYNKVFSYLWKFFLPGKASPIFSLFLSVWPNLAISKPSVSTLASMLLFISLNAISFHSAAQEMNFTNLTTAMGLSHGDITCLHQDYEGYIWIGTKDGLNKYNGINFTVYRNIKNDTCTLSSSQINYLYEDKSHNLWIGVGNGLCRYNRDFNQFERVNYLDDHNKNLEDHGIVAIFEDNTGRLWLGSINNGLYWVDHNNRKFHNIFETEIPAKTVTQIGQAPDGMLWFSFRGGENKEGGLIKYNLNSSKITIYNHEHPIFKLNDVYAFEFDQEGKLYLGTQTGLIVFDEKNMQWTHYTENSNNREALNNNLILSIVRANDGQMLIGTNGGGINLLDPNTGKFHSFVSSESMYSLLSNNISQIRIGHHGIIMVACWGGGVSISNSRFHRFLLYQDASDEFSLSGKSVTSFTEDQHGNIWIGTDGGGINCFNPKNKTFKKFRHKQDDNQTLTNNKVLAISAGKTDDLWVGLWDGGLNLFNLETGHPILKNKIPNMVPDSRKTSSIFNIYCHNEEVWVGTFQEGAYLYNKHTETIHSLKSLLKTPENISYNFNVNDFLYDHKGQLWIATEFNGLLCFDPQSGEHKRYSHTEGDSSSLPNNTVHAIYEDAQKRLWIGTDKGGLCLFTPTQNYFIKYTLAHGLPDNTIVGILEDNKGNLWLSTNDGLSRASISNHDEHPALHFKNYNVKDGLQGSNFNRWSFFKSSTGEMYFGGLNGFNVFHPDSIKDNNIPPPVYLSDFLLYNKQVKIGEKESPLQKHISQVTQLELKHNQNYFTFHFIALNYILSEKNQYAYIMEGFDTEWNYVGNKTEATYTNLQPGTYVFRVKACNNDGVWNEQGTSVTIRITPPWWKSTWFLAILMFILFILTFFFIRSFIKRIRKITNQSILNERNQLQTLINNIPDQAFIKDTRSRFIFANKITALQMNLKGQQELIGKTDFDFYPKEIAEQYFKREQEIMAAGIPLINEEDRREINNKTIYLSATKSPIINTKGETIGLVGIVRDITSKREDEIKIGKQSQELQVINKILSEANELLEKRQHQIEEQAEELMAQKEELINNNIKLNELNATKDKFFSIIAHDIKNPFSTIMGFSELLVQNYKRWEDDEKLNAAKIIYQSSENLFELLENLLYWSRSQRGLIECSPEKIVLKKNIDNMIAIFRYTADTKLIELKTSLSDHLLPVKADPQLLDTILRNLIGNAIKFTPKGGIVNIAVEPTNQMAHISVADNGIGIEKERLGTIFLPVNNQSTQGTENEKGSGLGLILVKEFVEKQGGSIWVESEPGKGSRFTFTLPLA